MRPERKAYHILGRQQRAGGLSMIPRRRMLGGFVASAAGFSLLRLSVAAALPPTPVQTAGPFYPLALPDDSDNDLIHVAGRNGTATGIVTNVSGRVLDPDGRPVAGARVEIWQCDANGRYHYVRDDRAGPPLDDNFQGYGQTATDGTGGYRFATIRPVPYPGRTPPPPFRGLGRGFPGFPRADVRPRRAAKRARRFADERARPRRPRPV